MMLPLSVDVQPVVEIHNEQGDEHFVTPSIGRGHDRGVDVDPDTVAAARRLNESSSTSPPASTGYGKPGPMSIGRGRSVKVSVALLIEPVRIVLGRIERARYRIAVIHDHLVKKRAVRLDRGQEQRVVIRVGVRRILRGIGAAKVGPIWRNWSGVVVGLVCWTTGSAAREGKCSGSRIGLFASDEAK